MMGFPYIDLPEANWKSGDPDFIMVTLCNMILTGSFPYFDCSLILPCEIPYLIYFSLANHLSWIFFLGSTTHGNHHPKHHPEPGLHATPKPKVSLDSRVDPAGSHRLSSRHHGFQYELWVIHDDWSWLVVYLPL